MNKKPNTLKKIIDDLKFQFEPLEDTIYSLDDKRLIDLWATHRRKYLEDTLEDGMYKIGDDTICCYGGKGAYIDFDIVIGTELGMWKNFKPIEHEECI